MLCVRCNEDKQFLSLWILNTGVNSFGLQSAKINYACVCFPHRTITIQNDNADLLVSPCFESFNNYLRILF